MSNMYITIVTTPCTNANVNIIDMKMTLITSKFDTASPPFRNPE